MLCMLHNMLCLCFLLRYITCYLICLQLVMLCYKTCCYLKIYVMLYKMSCYFMFYNTSFLCYITCYVFLCLCYVML